MRNFLITAFLIVAGLMQTGFAQNLSNRGKEFWVGYGHHQFMEPSQSNSQEMVLYLSAEQAATVTVSINGTAWTRTYNIPAGTVIASDYMPKSGAFDCRLYSLPVSFGGTNSEGAFRRGIHIVSNVPIVAYAHIFGSLSSGASMLMPVETWGYNYVSVNFTQSYANNCFSWMNVIAKENNTKVIITPSVPTRNGLPAGVPFTVILNKGEVYQMLGALSSGSNGYDLTGTTVKSVANDAGQCFPIATFSGSSRTLIGISCSPGGGDNMIQQVFPSQAWGKRYLTAPTSTTVSPATNMTNYFRVVVKDPTTVVKRNGVTLGGLIANTYYQFSSTVADYITADKPILVAQYIPSSGCYGAGLGDPEMFYISPIEQSIKRVAFYRNNREGITTNYLTLIIPTAGVFSLQIDGSSTFDHSYPLSNLPGYTVVIKRWPAAQAQATVTSDSAFTAITYGLGNVESYGYNAGTLINNLNVIGDIKNTFNETSNSNPFTCKNTPFEPAVLIAYKPTKMVWRFSALDTVIAPFADVTDLAPTPVDSQLVNGIMYYKYKIAQSYTFSDTGTYNVPIILTHPSIENCNNSEEVQIVILVKNNPTPDFSFTSSSSGTAAASCIADTVFFSGSSSGGSTGLVVNRFKWRFSPAPGDTANIQNPSKLFATPGTYNIKLSAITTEGCLGDTVKNIIIHARPAGNFTATPDSICEAGTISFATTATYTGPTPFTNWYWNYGNGQSLNSTTNAAVTQTYPVYGNYTIKHVVKVSNLCVSDTISKTIKVFAKPRPNFTYPLGCLAADGTAQFTDATVNPDGQILTYRWNFGDSSNSTALNPNTSVLQNPTHRYTQFGTYVVRLNVTTNNGCSKDTMISITFAVRPTLAFAPIASACINRAPFSIANGSVTNGVPGTGIYRGPGTDTSGIFNPATAGVGVHTIRYIFTANGGCRDSISQTVRVHPKPAVAFTISTSSFCADDSTVLTDQSTITNGTITERHWDFGDNTSAVYLNNTPFRRGYAPGAYTIKLYVVSDSACRSDTLSKPITVSPVPLLAFAPLPRVCVRTAPLSVATATVSNGVAGSGIYKGIGTTTPGVFNPAVAGVGVHTIWYVFTANGGCTDSISQTIRVNPSPAAAFTVSTSSFCADTSTRLTDQSTIAGGVIRDRRWDFGDGTNAVYQNSLPFTKSFAPGAYSIRLYVVSDSSCVSDTITKAIVVHAVPVANFDLPASICMPAGKAQFTNTTTVAGGGALSYTWDFGNGNTSTLQNPLQVYTGTGPYTVSLRATTTAGCVSNISKLLSAFYDQPIASFAVNPAILCQGTSNVFSDGSTAPNSSIKTWNWAFGDGSRASIRNPIKKFTLPGSYTISLNVESMQGCLSDTFRQTVFVYRQPLVNAGPSFTVPENTQIRFAATANDTTVNFLWTPGSDLSNDRILTPSLIARTDQIYYLTATGDGNCTATDSLRVKVLRVFTVPNAFSPNGDGINDTWAITNLVDYPGVTIEIYDRYGHQFLRQTGYNKPWDGTYEQKPLPIGTYYYIIKPGNGFPPVTGSVTLIR